MVQTRTKASSLLEALPFREQALQQTLNVSVIIPVFNVRYLVPMTIERILALACDFIARLEIIVVDDGSTDDTWAVLSTLAAAHPCLQIHRHRSHRGKGAAIRTALPYATGDVCVFHDVSLEYTPEDIPTLLRPFIDEGADVVYGSRYLMTSYRQALLYRHTLMNKILTSVMGWCTNLYLSDVETSYKVVNTQLLKSIPLRTDDAGLSVEMTLKLAKRRARIFEVPIRYAPGADKTSPENRVRRGISVLLSLLRFLFIDDIYYENEYGANILADLQEARQFNSWMADVLRPYVGDRVLEIGAGIGTLTRQFIPRELYVASDINPYYLEHLHSYSIGKPYVRVLKVDAHCSDDFRMLTAHFDTVLMINVLEHVPDEQVTLRNIHVALEPGGRAVILVPQHPGLYGSLDEVLEHRERYTAEGLARSLRMTGFRVEKIFDFNRMSVPAWWLNGRVLKRTGFSRVQLKTLELLMPIIRRIDRGWPWGGLSIIGIGIKE